jgi:hypothetical protein
MDQYLLEVQPSSKYFQIDLVILNMKENSKKWVSFKWPIMIEKMNKYLLSSVQPVVASKGKPPLRCTL